MRAVRIKLSDLNKFPVAIGFVGENEHTHVIIDCKSVFDDYPAAAPGLTVRSPGQTAPYPAIATRDGDLVVWEIHDSDLVYDGDGEFQLTFTVDEVIVKSYIGHTRILKSLAAVGNAPDAIADWIERANQALGGIPQTIDAALAEAKESGIFDGFSPTVTISEFAGGHNIVITDANGEHQFDILDGERGAPGMDGFSPTINAVKVGNTTTISITDEGGTSEVTILDGEQGSPGIDGTSPQVSVTDAEGGHMVVITDVTGDHGFFVQDGQIGHDGFAPTANVNKVENITTITITDAEGTTTADIYDGEDADPSILIDDTAGDNILNRTWSADKLLEEFTNNDRIFVATYGATTFAEISAAYNAGKIIFCKYTQSTGYVLSALSSYNQMDGFRFASQFKDWGLDSHYFIIRSSGGWIHGNEPYNAITTSTSAIEEGDYIPFVDVNSLNRLQRTSDLRIGTDSRKYLANDGTWQDLPDLDVATIAETQMIIDDYSSGTMLVEMTASVDAETGSISYTSVVSADSIIAAFKAGRHVTAHLPETVVHHDENDYIEAETYIPMVEYYAAPERIIFAWNQFNVVAETDANGYLVLHEMIYDGD